MRTSTHRQSAPGVDTGQGVITLASRDVTAELSRRAALSVHVTVGGDSSGRSERSRGAVCLWSGRTRWPAAGGTCDPQRWTVPGPDRHGAAATWLLWHSSYTQRLSPQFTAGPAVPGSGAHDGRSPGITCISLTPNHNHERQIAGWSTWHLTFDGDI